MVDAPEKIWACPGGKECVVSFTTPSLEYNVEYVRADLVATLEAEVSRLTALLDEAKDVVGPFAMEAAELAPGITNDCLYSLSRHPDLGLSDFDVGDLRAARAFAEKAGA